jgi:cation transporter-like permease
MFDADKNMGSNGLRVLWIILSGFGIVMILGVIVGFLSVHMAEGGGPLTISGYAILAAFMSVTLALAFAIWKLFRQMKRSGEKVPRREKVNNRYLLGTLLFSGVIGAGIA